MAKDDTAPRKKTPKAKAKRREPKVDPNVSLYPLTLDEAVDKLLKAKPEVKTRRGSVLGASTRGS